MGVMVEINWKTYLGRHGCYQAGCLGNSLAVVPTPPHSSPCNEADEARGQRLGEAVQQWRPVGACRGSPAVRAAISHRIVDVTLYYVVLSLAVLVVAGGGGS